MKFLSIDRIEESGVAVCEDENGDQWIISPKDLPQGAKEGIMLVLNKQGRWCIDKKLTQKRKAEILSLLNELKS